MEADSRGWRLGEGTRRGTPWTSNGDGGSGELYRALWPKLAKASLLWIDWGGVESGVRFTGARGVAFYSRGEG